MNRAKSAAWVVRAATAWLLLSLSVWGVVLWSLARDPDSLPAAPPAGRVSFPEEAAGTGADSLLAVPDRMERGDTLSSVLERNGIGSLEAHQIAQALSAVMDVRQLREGSELQIHYRAGGGAKAIWIDHGELEKIRLSRSEAGWQSERSDFDLERRTVGVTGVLEDNLFLSMARLGEAASLTVAFASVFSWDFDFASQSRSGDRFSLVVEKLYRDGDFVGYGALHAARYVSLQPGGRSFDAFLYEDPSGRRDYYDSLGNSLRKAFLRAPVDFERISSRFSYSRLHPIHNRRMPHLGVDYAAAKGTPVYSVAAGVVVERGYRGGGGNTITVRHAMGFTSKYLHLSRYARGLAVGTRVEQKEVIGFVGATGTATAPHLDFRLLHHGKPVNPLTQIFPPGPPVADEFREDFESKKGALEKELASLESKRSVVTTD
jgi:murein DD-endopeptidase MepM/ murein hydrolase activator NlpD